MLLKDMKFFKGLSNVEQSRLFGYMEEVEFSPGTVIFNQGEKGDSMYIIVSGNLELYIVDEDNCRHTLALLGEGEIFGEMALLTGNPRTASAAAVSQLLMYRINSETFNRLVVENPSLSSYFITMLSNRLARTNNVFQKSETSKVQLAMKEIKDLPLEVQKAILSASVLPCCTEEFLSEYLEIKDLPQKIAACREIYPDIFLRDDNEAAITINPESRGYLKEVYIKHYDREEKELLISSAVEYYVSQGKLKYAVQTYIENNYWDKACSLVEKHRDRFSDSDQDKYWIANLFQECPDEILFKYNKVFLFFLQAYLIHNPGQGLLKLEQALSNAEYLFVEAQDANLYKMAAEFCNKLGYHQKAMEYLNMASTAAASYSDNKIYGKTKKTLKSNEDRDFEMKKQSIDMSMGIAMAENTKKSFLGINNITVLGIVVLSILILVFSYNMTPVWGFSKQAMLFIGVTVVAVIFWVTHIVPDYIVSLLMAMVWVVTGLVKPEVAVSGFGDPIWIYILGILAFGAAVSKSGLLYRMSLYILKAFPKTYLGQLAGLAFSGILFTPLMPYATGKAALGAQIAQNISESMGFANKSKGSAGLGLSAMIFFGYLTPFFLTGSYGNVGALRMVAGGVKVTWFQWIFYSLPALLIFTVLMFITIYNLFRPDALNKKLSSEIINEQLKILGGFTRDEVITAFVACGVMLMLVTQPIHHFEGIWLMLVGFSILVISGVLDERTLKSKIDWPFLLFIGIAFSFVKAQLELGIIDVITDDIAAFMAPFTGSPYIFLPALVILGFLITLIINDDPESMLFIMSISPLFVRLGIHPWILIFIAGMTTTPFFFSYQSTIYLTAYYSSGERAFSHGQGKKLSLYYAGITMITVILSIPFWQLMGLI